MHLVSGPAQTGVTLRELKNVCQDEWKLAFSHLRFDLAAVIMGKKRPDTNRLMLSLEEAAWKCVDAVHKTLDIKLTDAYDAAKPKDDKKTKGATATPTEDNTCNQIRMRTTSHLTGGITDAPTLLLRECGFDLNDLVVCVKKDDDVVEFDTRYTIIKVIDDRVQLATDDAIVELPIDYFQNKYFQKAPDDKETKIVESIITQRPASNIDYQIQLMKSRIVIEINDKMNLHPCDPAWFELTYAPRKIAEAKVSFAPDKLCLVPASLSITSKLVTTESGKSEDDVKWPSLDVGALVLTSTGSVKFTVTPTFTLATETVGRKRGKPGFVTPFAFVYPTETQEDANLELFKANDGDIVPCLRNHVEIKKGDTLKIFKPKPAKPNSTSKASKRKRAPEPLQCLCITIQVMRRRGST